MKTIEIHLPCLCYQFNESAKHERWEQSISFDYCGKQYVFHYCSHCIDHVSNLAYSYGGTSKVLDYIFNWSGIFFPIKYKWSKKQISFGTGYISESILVWYRRGSYDAIERKRLNKKYEEIYKDSFNIYYALKMQQS